MNLLVKKMPDVSNKSFEIGSGLEESLFIAEDEYDLISVSGNSSRFRTKVLESAPNFTKCPTLFMTTLPIGAIALLIIESGCSNMLLFAWALIFCILQASCSACYIGCCMWLFFPQHNKTLNSVEKMGTCGMWFNYF